ncbi:MAG: CBS domain-containing protein [Candidatus Ancillula trichonymphae]|nr:CBS domain-containing protein [Candidatus Ancillula trichonymphae]
MKSGTEIFVSRLENLPVFDPNGDQVGRIRDVVLILGPKLGARAVGFVVQILGKRKVFLPLTRVTSITGDAIIITGLLNMRRFQKRDLETLGFSDLMGRILQVPNEKTSVVENLKVEDFSILRTLGGDWKLLKLFVRRIEATSLIAGFFGKKGEAKFLDAENLKLFVQPRDKYTQSNDHILESIEDMKPTDVADVLLDLGEKRQFEVASGLDDKTLADALEEMPENDQLLILANFEQARVADVLEEMEPDDATDLLNKMPEEEKNELLEQMNPEDADDIRQLLKYGEFTAGGLMTTNPVVLQPDATVALALAQIRREELSPSLASLVFVCGQPTETPTGRFLGVLQFQQLLRYPPHLQLGQILDTNAEFVEPDTPLAIVARVFAAYNAFVVPVLDSNKRLLGAITVDDVIDHILPENWRDDL